MLLYDLAQLVILVLLAFIVIVGWGRLGLLILQIKVPVGFENQISWIGFSLIITFLEIIHLFTAISWKTSLLVCAIGICGLGNLLNFKTLKNWQMIMTSKLSSLNKLLLIIGIVFITFYMLRSMGYVNNYDSGIYHFASIKWVNEYPIIPGLGNVFSALAYNQSYFLFLGLLNVFPLWNHGVALGGLLLLLMTGLSLAQFCSRSSKVIRWAFGMPIFIFLNYLASTLSNPAPDTAVSFLQIVMFLSLIMIYESSKEQQETRMILVSTLIFLSIAIVTIKVSSAMFALITLGLTFLIAFKNFLQNRNWKLILLVSLIFGLIHLFRGYILSGAPLYPSEIGSLLNLPWAMSKESIFGERLWIYVWSRWPGANPADVIGSWSWFSHWLTTISLDVWLFAFVLTFLSVFNIFLFYLNNPIFSKTNRFILTLPLLISIIFWFFTAPQIRFLGAIPILLLSLNLWILFEAKKDTLKLVIIFNAKNSLFFKWIFIFIICLISLKFIGLRSISTSGWSPLPVVSKKEIITENGISVNAPLSGNQCWETTLPCSPLINSKLDLIKWPSGNGILNIIQKRPMYRLN